MIKLKKLERKLADSHKIEGKLHIEISKEHQKRAKEIEKYEKNKIKKIGEKRERKKKI